MRQTAHTAVTGAQRPASFGRPSLFVTSSRVATPIGEQPLSACPSLSLLQWMPDKRIMGCMHASLLLGPCIGHLLAHVSKPLITPTSLQVVQSPHLSHNTYCCSSHASNITSRRCQQSCLFCWLHPTAGCRRQLRLWANNKQAEADTKNAATKDGSAAARQMLGMKGASDETDIWKIRVQLTKPVTWVPLIWGEQRAAG